jgi:dTDP-glucose pyrophosphorylase
MRDEYEITDTIQIMIDLDLTVRTANSIKSDINVTTPADLLHCNMLELSKIPDELLVGERTQIHPKAKLERCVLGSNVHITHPINLSNTLVFDNTIVEAQNDFEQFILIPDGILDCGYLQAGVRRAP